MKRGLVETSSMAARPDRSSRFVTHAAITMTAAAMADDRSAASPASMSPNFVRNPFPRTLSVLRLEDLCDKFPAIQSKSHRITKVYQADAVPRLYGDIPKLR